MMASAAWVPARPVVIGVATCAPWFAAGVLTVWRRHARIVGVTASLVSAATSALLLQAAPSGESLYEALMLLFSSLTMGGTLVLPKRDCGSQTISGMLFLLGATLFAYSTDNLLGFLVAWILSTIPFLM